MEYDWNYGENGHQKYYEARIGKDYLCIFADDWNPNTWLGMWNNNLIHNKTKNDRVRRKNGFSIGCHPSELSIDHMLTSNNPEYMMKKVEYCYLLKIIEISE